MNKIRQIEFSEPNTARLIEKEAREPGAGEVAVKMAYTAISAGTERANITGEKNINGGLKDVPVSFPRYCGYSGSGTVIKVGDGVNGLKAGDRVATCWGVHASEAVLPVRNVVKLEHDTVSMKEASLGLISTFSLAGVRKTRLEIGESAIVMGLGVLGIFAVQFLKAGGAVPVIAADPVEEKRKKALEMGADYALDPNAADFAARVKSLTYGRGADAAIEVSGVGAALVQVLECMAPMGRVALLGCTRNSNFTVDFYHCVHFPGVSLIGAHTLARPQYESSPHNWTTRDDVRAALALAGAGRISFEKMISEIHSPSECCEVYDRVINEKSFPSGVLFDWEHFEQNI